MNYHDEVMREGPPGSLTKAEKEMIVVATSAANRCLYCVVAHGAILRIYTKNKTISDVLALGHHKERSLTPRQIAMLDYSVKLARQPEVRVFLFILCLCITSGLKPSPLGLVGKALNSHLAFQGCGNQRGYHRLVTLLLSSPF